MTECELTAHRSALFGYVAEKATATPAPENLTDEVCRLERALEHGGHWAADFDADFWRWAALSVIDAVADAEHRSGLRRWWHYFLRDGRQRGLPDHETFRVAAAWAVGTVVQLLRGDSDERENETEE